MGPKNSSSFQMQKDTLLEFSISPRHIALTLVGATLGLAMAHIAIHLLPLLGVAPEDFGLWHFFYIGYEANLPTYFSTLILLIAGLLLIPIARHESERQKAQDWHWWGLAFGLLFMSVDEAAQIHEGVVGETLINLLGRGEGIMYYRWYLPYIPIVIVIGLLYVPFLRKLPRRFALGFLAAGFVFLTGALGVEMIQAYISFHDLGGQGISMLVEETCEMLGIVLLIYTLLLYLSDAGVTLRLRFSQSASNS